MTDATHVSLYHGPTSCVTVHQYPAAGDAPILTVSSPTSHLTLSVMCRAGVTGEDIAFARDLAAGAAQYLGALESTLTAQRQRTEGETPAARREVPA